MDSILDVCKEQLRGWYDSIDRLRVGGVLRGLQQSGSVVNFMKLLYPGEDRPLRHFSELTARLTAGVERLVRQGIPYLEAPAVRDPAVQAWLEPLYAARPRAGSVVAIVRTIEGVSSFSCRPRQRPTAKGDPKTGRRPTNTAEHHLRRGQHRVCVYYFFVFDAHWGVGDHTADDQSFDLKGAKALGQHPIGEVRDCTLDGRVARFSLKERLKNGACPAATDELDSPMKAGAYL